MCTYIYIYTFIYLCTLMKSNMTNICMHIRVGPHTSVHLRYVSAWKCLLPVSQVWKETHNTHPSCRNNNAIMLCGKQVALTNAQWGSDPYPTKYTCTSTHVCLYLHIGSLVGTDTTLLAGEHQADCCCVIVDLLRKCGDVGVTTDDQAYVWQAGAASAKVLVPREHNCA